MGTALFALCVCAVRVTFCCQDCCSNDSTGIVLLMFCVLCLSGVEMTMFMCLFVYFFFLF